MNKDEIIERMYKLVDEKHHKEFYLLFCELATEFVKSEKKRIQNICKEHTDWCDRMIKNNELAISLKD